MKKILLLTTTLLIAALAAPLVRTMERPSGTRGVSGSQAVSLSYDLGNGNFIRLDDPQLETVLQTMDVGPKGRNAISNRHALAPTRELFKKWLEGASFNELPRDGIKGLLLAMAAVLKENPDFNSSGKFKENPNVEWNRNKLVGYRDNRVDTEIDVNQLMRTFYSLTHRATHQEG